MSIISTFYNFSKRRVLWRMFGPKRDEVIGEWRKLHNEELNDSGFGGLGVACWPLVPKFKPGRSRRIFQGEKILNTITFGGDVKPSVPCRRFAACKTPLK
jgi:hypothetical protein